MVIGNDLLIRTFLFVNSFASFNLRYKYWKDGQIQETEQFPVNKGLLLQTPHLQRYITQGNKMLKDLKALLNASDWQFTQDSKGVLIKEWYHPKLQSKIFYAEAEIDTSPENLFRDWFHNITQLPTWNTNFKKVQVLKRLSNHTQIVYLLWNPKGGGLLNQRDAVTLYRAAYLPDGAYIVAEQSTKWKGRPETSDYVRAHTSLAGRIFEPVPGHPRKTKIRFIQNTDFRLGWLSFIQPSLVPDGILNYIENLQRRVAQQDPVVYDFSPNQKK